MKQSQKNEVKPSLYETERRAGLSLLPYLILYLIIFDVVAKK
jgi:hypothetical protein